MSTHRPVSARLIIFREWTVFSDELSCKSHYTGLFARQCGAFWLSCWYCSIPPLCWKLYSMAHLGLLYIEESFVSLYGTFNLSLPLCLCKCSLSTMALYGILRQPCLNTLWSDIIIRSLPSRFLWSTCWLSYTRCYWNLILLLCGGKDENTITEQVHGIVCW